MIHSLPIKVSFIVHRCANWWW